ncbi:MAG: hypothetical protein IJN09_05380 [Oscillospiraceae bacterium]|nr:hypothetical protein [Oscillospiraceae bacterium]
MKRSLILNGVHIGEHSFVPENIIEEINERVIAPGYNFVTLRPKNASDKTGARIDVPQDYYIKWARYLAENKIYFAFLYTVQYPPPGRRSALDAETIAKMKEIAGEYFLGEAIGEPGSSNACKLQGYFQATANRGADPNAQLTAFDMTEARANYVAKVSGFADTARELGFPNVLSVEATMLSKYNTEAGVNLPMVEVFNSNPDEHLPTGRGAAKACGAPIWGTYFAGEWYAGMRHSDPLKRKRVELGYKFAYLSGSSVFCLESGDEKICAYGEEHPPDSEICNDYRRIMDYITELSKTDERPSGGPKIKLAFVHGKDDAWGGWGASAVWNQFLREEWGHNEAEHSWRLLDELGTRRKWSDIANYGDHDYSSAPAYGLYDIIPIESSVDVLSQYEYLIFLGWNTMTDENMDKLTEYVGRGGKLLMSAAHLNCNPQRKGNLILPPEEKIKELLGCRFTGASVRTNCGTKFIRNSLNEEILLPGSTTFLCDPLYSAGYTEYLKCELCGAEPSGFYADSFGSKPTDIYTVIENRVGKGTVTLVTSINYPGHPALFPLYRMLAREMITSSARNCDIKIIGSERLRYAVYEGDKVYLLNTDYDMPIAVKIIKGEKEKVVMLDSLELKTMYI